VEKPGLFDRLSIGFDSVADTLYNAGDIVVDRIRGTGEYKDVGSSGERFTYITHCWITSAGAGFSGMFTWNVPAGDSQKLI
jgi:hypothetical protein